jgi:hypothetical protein
MNLRSVLTPVAIVIRLFLATICLFGYPVFAKWLQSSASLELARSVAVYSVGAIVLLLVVIIFRSLNADTVRLLGRTAAKTSQTQI